MYTGVERGLGKRDLLMSKYKQIFGRDGFPKKKTTSNILHFFLYCSGLAYVGEKDAEGTMFDSMLTVRR